MERWRSERSAEDEARAHERHDRLLAEMLRDEAAKIIDAWPKNAKEYRVQIAAKYRQDMNTLRSSLTSIGGYGVDQATIEAFDEAFTQFLDALPTAAVRFDNTAKQREMTRLRSFSAQRDPAFARFLETVTS